MHAHTDGEKAGLTIRRPALLKHQEGGKVTVGQVLGNCTQSRWVRTVEERSRLLVLTAGLILEMPGECQASIATGLGGGGLK